MKMNLPNKLTVLRMLMIPVFLLFYLGWDPIIEPNRLVATLIFVVASATDAIDGYIARRDNLVTNFGKFMDPLADKLLVCSALIVLSYTKTIGVVPVIIIISREFIVTGFRTLAADSGIVIAASKWGKAKTISQMIMIPFAMACYNVPYYTQITTVLVYISVILAVISGYDYIHLNKQVLTEQK